MAAVMNGMAMHGGVLPVGGTFFVFSDYMRGAVRLAALQRGQGHLLVDARLGRPRRGRPDPPADRAPRRAAGHAGPARDPPGRRQRDRRCAGRSRSSSDGPTGLILTRQDLPVLDGTAEQARRAARGAYVVPTATASTTATTSTSCSIGTGSEVSVCLDAAAAARSRRRRGPGRVDAVLGAVRGAGRRLPGRGAAGRRADARGRGRHRRSAGTAGPTTRCRSTASARRRPARSRSRSSASPPTNVADAGAPAPRAELEEED